MVIEATQAYGNEEHSDEEMAAAIIPKPSKVGKDRNVEVKETLAPRSRRGKRGRTAFAESALILETPLNKVSLLDVRLPCLSTLFFDIIIIIIIIIITENNHRSLKRLCQEFSKIQQLGMATKSNL